MGKARVPPAPPGYTTASNYDKQLVVNSLKHLKVNNEAKLNNNPDAIKSVLANIFPNPFIYRKNNCYRFTRRQDLKTKEPVGVSKMANSVCT